MNNIDEYKSNFIETRISQDDLESLDNKFSMDTLKGEIGKYISDMDISIPNAIHGIFDKLNRPVLIVCDDNIEYANTSFCKTLNITDKAKVLHEKFLKFVSQDDWDYIAENIGDILTGNGVIELRMLNANYKVIKISFDTLYLEDSLHFCFILIGRPVETKVVSSSVMYDDTIGLPKFNIFEDRLQTAINYEVYKDSTLPRNKIAICGIAIKNYTGLKNDGQAEFIVQRMAEKLLLSLNKIYTVALGEKYQFFILMPDMKTDIQIVQEVEKIQELLNQPVANVFLHYDVSVAMGVSIYPETSQSPKKLISQAEMATRQALKEKQSKIVYYGI